MKSSLLAFLIKGEYFDSAAKDIQHSLLQSACACLKTNWKRVKLTVFNNFFLFISRVDLYKIKQWFITQKRHSTCQISGWTNSISIKNKLRKLNGHLFCKDPLFIIFFLICHHTLNWFANLVCREANNFPLKRSFKKCTGLKKMLCFVSKDSRFMFTV